MATLNLGSRPPAVASDPIRLGLLARIRASRPVQVVLAIGTLVLILLMAGTLAVLLELRAREIDDARRSLLNLNALLAESTGRTLENVDLVLQSVLDEMKDNDVNSAAAVGRLKTSKPFHEALKSRVSGLPQLEALSVVDKAGRLVSYSRGFPIPDIDLSDREHFKDMGGRSTLDTYVSAPVQNRATNAWSVYLAKRITAGDGNFLGVVYAGIDLDYFEGIFARLALSRGSSVSLWRLDGTLLVRHPAIGEIGRRFDTPAFRDAGRASPPIVYETDSSILGKPTLVVRNVVQGFPLATVFARTRADILAQSRREIVALLIAAALLATAIVALTAALVRQFWIYEEIARVERERAAAIAGLGELEDQLRQSQKLEVIGQLASGVAHDFNNLLTVVIGNLDRLSRRSANGSPDLARYIDGARAGAERAAGLSQRLLAFSRRQPLEATRLELSDVTGRLSDLLQQSLGKRAVLELKLAPDLPSVHVDRGGLESALLNLVVNARDAMPNGGTVTITTHRPYGQEPSNLVCVTVADTGTGMAPEVAERAFEPFFTTKEAGVGTGLGLAQVAGFVRENDGSVSIDTAPGQGCRITLCLPTVDRAQAPDDAAAPSPDLKGPA